MRRMYCSLLPPMFKRLKNSYCESYQSKAALCPRPFDPFQEIDPTDFLRAVGAFAQWPVSVLRFLQLKCPKQTSPSLAHASALGMRWNGISSPSMRHPTISDSQSEPSLRLFPAATAAAAAGEVGGEELNRVVAVAVGTMDVAASAAPAQRRQEYFRPEDVYGMVVVG
uniref:Uncharacterized protein n=1 Tax=Cyclophora tenuis TaxID=216820 RepID=A0A7S1D4G4_CYCTE|mmetsp:Transcript_22664/g.38534  ORF Transcript_22664/g.38534 Transcript_22664/m.38534 type:complete len:168 (+) Transcript_22664:144-647(+)